jgi:hypothetical protein
MGSFHSGIDDEFLVGNHDVTLVWSHTGDYAVKVRTRLPCGHFMEKKGKLIIESPEPEDLDSFVEEAKKQISQHTYTYKPYVYPADRSAFGNVGRLCNTCQTPVAYGFGAWLNGTVHHVDCIPKESEAKAYLEFQAERALADPYIYY